MPCASFGGGSILRTTPSRRSIRAINARGAFAHDVQSGQDRQNSTAASSIGRNGLSIRSSSSPSVV
jgi:hypothetical protein